MADTAETGVTRFAQLIGKCPRATRETGNPFPNVISFLQRVRGLFFEKAKIRPEIILNIRSTP